MNSEGVKTITLEEHCEITARERLVTKIELFLFRFAHSSDPGKAVIFAAPHVGKRGTLCSGTIETACVDHSHMEGKGTKQGSQRPAAPLYYAAYSRERNKLENLAEAELAKCAKIKVPQESAIPLTFEKYTKLLEALGREENLDRQISLHETPCSVA